jgi:hypothetical protein
MTGAEMAEKYIALFGRPASYEHLNQTEPNAIEA